jgi:branched-chain amino acid transport system ATP-binding protein
MLRLEQMSCGYGAFRAVDGLDLDVGEGEVFALVGANGAGKSSTIMAIVGHVDVFGGRILFDGADITKEPARKRVRRGIAVAPEGRQLFQDLTVDENLTIGGYIHDREKTVAGRTRVLELFPRLAERLDQLAGSMSGGEQQMLAIGRALMAEPKLLIIDEVSLGLMPKVVDLCYAAIEALKKQGITILLVEQSTERALQIADNVCVLESGREVWKGPAAEARDNPALVEAYLGLRQEADA